MADTTEKLDIFTGLPKTESESKEPKIDIFTGKPKQYGPTPRYGAPVRLPKDMGMMDAPSKYAEYGVPTIPGLDIEEMRAQRQTRAEKWGRGAMKAGVTLVGAVAENTLGYLDGFGEYLSTGDSTKLFDNQVGQFADKANKWMQENYPNYYTKEEQDSIGLESLGYANFWGDKALNGFAYALGSIGTLWITGGVGLAARGVGLGAKLAAKGAKSVSKGLGMYEGAKAVATGTQIGKALTGASAYSKRALNAAKQAEIGMAMSYAEASVEAREILKHTEQVALERIAGDRPIASLSEAERQQAREEAAIAAQMGFAGNLAVLAPTNLLMFGKMLSPKYNAARPKMAGMSMDAKTGKIVDRWSKTGRSNWMQATIERYYKEPVKNAISETFQEGTQFAIQEAANAIVEDKGTGSWEDWGEALMEGYSESIRSKEGIESLMLGFIIGGFMGGAGSVVQRFNKKSEDKTRNKVVDMLNNENFYKLVDRGATEGKKSRAAQRMQAALEQGDHKAYRDAQFDLILEEVALHDRMGSLDLFLRRLEDAKNMETAEFAEAFGISEGVEFDQAQIVNDLTNEVKKYVKQRERVDTRFPSTERKGLPRLLTSKKVKLEEKQRLMDMDIYKTMLIRESMKAEDIDGRISKLINEVNELAKGNNLTEEEFSVGERETFAAADTPLGSVYGITELKKETKEKLNNIYKSIPDKQTADEIKLKMRDLERLSTDRAKAVKAINELLGSPEERAIAVERQKAAEKAEAAAAADKRADEMIKTTNTAEELATMVKASDYSEFSKATRDKLTTESKKRKAAEAAIDSALEEEDLNVLEDELKGLIAKEKKTPEEVIRAHVLKQHVSKRRKEGKVKGKKKVNAEKEAEAAAERKRRKEEEAARKKGEAEGHNENKDAPTSADPAPEPTQQPLGEVNNQNGELKNVGGVVEFEGGEVVLGAENKICPVTLNRKQLKTKEGLAEVQEKGVEFELRTVESGGKRYPWILIKVKGTDNYIGYLPDPMNPKYSAKTGPIYQRLIENPGETISGTLTKVEYTGRNGFINEIELVDGEAQPVLKPLSEIVGEDRSNVEGFVGYGIVKTDKIDIATPVEEGLKKRALAVLGPKRANEENGYNFRNGQIVMILELPNGEFTALPMNTRPVGEEGLQKLMDALRDPEGRTVESISDFVGMPGDFNENSTLLLEQTDEGEIIINFQHKGKAIRISRTELLKLKETGRGKFSVGQFETVPDETSNTGKRRRFTRESGETSTSTYAELSRGLVEAFEQAVKDTKSQIDQNRMSNPDYMQKVETELLRTDVRFFEGMPTFDHIAYYKVEDEFSPEEVVGTAPLKPETGPKKEPAPTQSGPGSKSKFGDAPLRRKKGKKAGKKEGGKNERQDVLEQYKAIPDNKYLFGQNTTPKDVLTKYIRNYLQDILTLDIETGSYDGTNLILELKAGPTIRVPMTGQNLAKGQNVFFNVDTEQVINTYFDALESKKEKPESDLSPEEQQRLAELREMQGDEGAVDEDVALRLGTPTPNKVIDETAAIAWLKKRFGEDSVVIYRQLKQVGDNIVHGYMENAAVYLYSKAEVGTEYHEAFHLFFRTLLSDKKRQQLYDDAVKQFGEPTAEDIAKARRGQREMTNEEARLLALEERMAEEFRNYVIAEQAPKSLGQRIVKFFKDLVAYIKALATDRVSVRQAFSLIEANKIPKSYSRTAEKFSPGKSFMLREYAADPALHKELVNIAIAKAIKTAQTTGYYPGMMQDLLGTPATRNVEGGPSELRSFFLSMAFHKDMGGIKAPLERRQLDELAEAIDSGNRDTVVDVMEKYDLYEGAPDVDRNGVSTPDAMLGIIDGVEDEDVGFANSRRFLEVYENWHDKQGELGGVKMRGFRSDIRDELRRFGYKTFDNEVVKEIAEEEDENGLDPQQEEGADRIYSVARDKVDPAKQLGEKAKRALSLIPVSPETQSKFGFQTYIPLEDIYNEIAGTVVDSADYTEMLTKLQKRSSKISTLAAVYDFMNNLSAPEQALMYSVFAQSMNEYKLVKFEEGKVVGETERTVPVVKIINSSAGSIERYYREVWKNRAVSPLGLYTVNTAPDGGIKDIQADQAKLKKIQSKWEAFQESSKTPGNVKAYYDLADILMEMGIMIADTQKEARLRVREALTSEGITFEEFLKQDTNLYDIITRKLAPGKQTYTNIFETEGRTISYIAKTISAKFEGPKGASFFDGSGNMRFPINLKSDLNITTELIKSEEYARMMAGENEETGAVGSFVKGQNYGSLAYMYISNENGRDAWTIVDLDSAKDADDTVKDYEDLDFQSGLATDLAMFSSQDDVKYIAIDTQGDRSRLSYVAIPNFMVEKHREKFGMKELEEGGRTAIQNAIRRTFLLDLHRIAVTEGELSQELFGYHSRDQYKMLQLGFKYDTDVFGDVAQDAKVFLENEGASMSEALSQAVTKYEAMVEAKLQEYLGEIIMEFGGKDKAEAQSKAEAFVRATIPPKGNYIKGGEMRYLKNFVEMSVMGRLMTREIFRSGVNYTKDGADYNKRSGLSSTPGTLPFIIDPQNPTDPNNPDYGMLPTFTEVTVKDIKTPLSTNERDTLKKAIAKNIGKEAGEKAAETIMSSFDSNNGTDAQGIISIDFYRRIRMGIGQWTETDEEVYKEYKAGEIGSRKWDGKRSPIIPIKPSYEYRMSVDVNGYRHLVPVSHKNSYVVLTDEIAEGIPNLEGAVRAMERDSNPIDVINTISAKKLGSFMPVDMQDVERAAPQTLDSRGLKFPQILPNKVGRKMTFGRQPRTNMFANVKADTNYVVGEGIRISGKQLNSIYQGAVVSKLEQGHDKVVRALGYDKVLEAKDDNERREALAEMLPKLRDLMNELGVEKDYAQNILDALEPMADQNGNVSTALPFAFTPISGRLEPIIGGLFRKKAYLQKLTGAEMVQFAEFEQARDVEKEDKEDRGLAFYSIEKAKDSEGNEYTRVAEAEVDIRYDVVEAMGLDPETVTEEELNDAVKQLIGYRIPQQGKSSMLLMKVRKILPRSHKSAVRVPPGVTTMMGSDFDIDKMFVIFPEVERTEEGELVKITPDYNTMKGMDEATLTEYLSVLSEKELNNIVFDSFRAVGSSVAHIEETLAPMDLAPKDDPILQGARAIGAQDEVSIDINSPAARIRSARDNMFSMALRGIYATSIGGRNAVVTAMAMNEGLTFGEDGFIIDGEEVGEIVIKSKFPDSMGVYRYTDYYLSQYLSKAVDSVKNPIQGEINDNRLTAPLTSYMLSIGMEPRQIIAFLNVPVIREITEDALKNDNTLRSQLRLTKGAGKLKPAMKPLSTVEMQELAKLESSEKMEASTIKQYMRALLFMTDKASRLEKLYRVVRPDTIDQAGTIPQHLAKIEDAQSGSENVFGGVDAMMQMTQGGAYKIARGYYAAIEKSLDVMSALGFVARQPAVVSFKSYLKNMLEVNTLNDVQHRDINRAITHHMITKPGSPIFDDTNWDLLDEEFIVKSFKDGLIVNVFKKMVELTKDTENIVVNAFDIAVEEIDGENFTYLQINKNKIDSTLAKNEFTIMLEAMINNPEMYGKENAKLVKGFARTVITNSIITTGFAPGLKSYFELIPVSYWRSLRNAEGLDVTAHLNLEMQKLESDQLLRDEFTVDFLTNYGVHSARKRHLVPKNKGKMVRSGGNVITGSDSKYRIQIIDGKKALLQRTGEMPTGEGIYTEVATKGRQYVFYETHIKNKQGEKVTYSLYGRNDLPQLSLDTFHAEKDEDVQQQRVSFDGKETPVGAQEKMDRLRASFAKAGIDVQIVEDRLAPGVKGEVRDGKVVFDPSQMTADTVYHEFGHILVDMLPQDVLERFIAQAKELNPEVARAVQAAYPELSEMELGKEILVTVIGLEGAKIERKNPSKLQVFINKVLRAIGKLFGVKPNEAAVLAEQMFAGQIRTEGLSMTFNPKVQRSKNLENKMNKVYNQVKDSLARQRLRLEKLPESEQQKRKLREIAGLDLNIDQMKEKIEKRKADLDAFFSFQQYVVGRVTILQNLMDDLIQSEKLDYTQEEMAERLNRIDEIRQTLESLYTTEERNSTVRQIGDLLRSLRSEGVFDEAQSAEAREVMFDLEDSLGELRDLNDVYFKTIAPMTARLLVSYSNPKIAKILAEEKKRVLDTKDLSDFRRTSIANRMPEFVKLRQEFRSRKKTDDPMSQQEFDERALELKMKHIDDRMIGKAQLEIELTEAQRSKSWFSYALDPILYSRKANLKLFGLALKDALNRANDKAIDFLYDLEPRYQRFKDWKGTGEFNEAKLNEDLLETTTVLINGEPTEVLSLVQEFDTKRFYADYYAELERLADKYKKPDADASKADRRAWYEGESYQEYKAELADWFAANTEPVQGDKDKGITGARKAVVDMFEEELKLKNTIALLTLEDNPRNREQIIILEAELKKVQKAQSRTVYDAGGGKRIYMHELAQPNSSYRNPKWDTIQNTPELKQYYDYIVKSYHDAQKRVGSSALYVNNWDKYSYVMPSVRKDNLAMLQDEGWKEMLAEKGRQFRRLDTDTEYGMMTDADGQEVKGVPKFYTNPVAEKFISRDVASSIAQFVHMSHNFEEKSKLAGLVNSMLILHERKGTLLTNDDNQPVLDKVSKISRDAAQSITKFGTGEDLDFRHLSEFIDSVFYGQLETGNQANLNKFVSKANALTALSSLSLNTLQAGNQFYLDNAMTTQEAVAGQFFDYSTLWQARQMYAAEGAALGDVGKFVPRSKLGKAMRYFDAMTVVGEGIGKQLTGNAAKKVLQSTDPYFFLQHGIEHQTSGVRMLAVLLSTQPKDKDGNVLLTEDGKEATLWDMLVEDEKGKMSIDPRVANVTQSEIVAKLSGLSKRTNQVKGNFDEAMAQRTALGKLLLLFRNYFVPGFRRRFGHGDMYFADEEMGEVSRGYYMTLMGYLGNVFRGRGVSGSLQLMGDVDKQNMRRVAYEGGLILSTMAIFSILSKTLEDDDEDDYGVAFAAYQARRLQTELLAFANPYDVFRMIKRPMATVNHIEAYTDVLLSLYQTGMYETAGFYEDKALYQRKSGAFEKGDYKLKARIQKITPVFNGWKTSFLAEGGTEATKDKLKWFK